jgi:hypothetical protein
MRQAVAREPVLPFNSLKVTPSCVEMAGKPRRFAQGAIRMKTTCRLPRDRRKCLRSFVHRAGGIVDDPIVTRFPAYVLVSLMMIVLASDGVARAAAPVQGAILGQVRDIDSGQPVDGVTVVASGPEGDVAMLTDAKGNYRFLALPIGHYAIRFHRNEVLAERDATVGVDKTVRVNIRLPAVPSETQTVAAPYTAPAIDVGSSRIGSTFNAEFIDNIPNRGDDVASLIQKTPGSYQDDVGLSLSGGTGADNAYYLEGLNVTALRDGLLGINLKSPFLEEVEVVSAGYGAEYGRALGGVVNMALKSGTNQWKGGAFTWVEPGWMAGSPQRILSRSTVLTGNTQPDYTTQIGAEVGGPIIENKLFIWLGYAPEMSRSHFVQYTDRFVDNDGDGQLDGNPDGSPIVQPLFTRLIPQESTTHNYAGKLTWRLGSEHMLSISLAGTRKDEEYMRSANMDLLTGMSHEITSRQDLIAHWQSAFFQRHWRVDASLGLHSEGYSRHSPFGDVESMNDVNWYNSPSLAQFDPALAPYCQDDPTTGFQPCPVQGYQSGGFGVMREISAYRLAGQVRFTNVFSALGLHELKYGVDYEFNQYDDKRWNSGLDGSRGSVYVFPTGNGSEYAPSVLSLYRLPDGMSMGDVNDPLLLTQSPYYQDSIRAKTRAFNNGLFLQESYMPLPNLTINAGLRWEAQRFTDYAGHTALTIGDSLAPRLGVVYDPTKEGRSKVFAHYGQYYESIPMDMVNRAFGGEGVVGTDYPASCAAANWRSCQGDPQNPPQSYPISGDRLIVQPNIKGSYNNEIVLGGQYQILHDWVFGASVIYRWLGRVVEDTGGSVQDGMGATTLANPTDPKPERTYKALQLTTNKRLARHWFFAGSYTYSRTMGNYSGLYSADSKQLDPNLTTQYDVSELMTNRNGPLPNDRPHVIHLDGYYQFVWGRHLIAPGLGFSGQSGVPITPLGRAPIMGENETFILPRGSAGRTPFVTQLDAHLSYRTTVAKILSAEVFVDIFNLFNQRTVLTEDAEYTVDRVMPAPAGTPLTQVPVVDGSGTPICASDDQPCTTYVTASPNPNYLRPTSYQAPISGRMGVRVLF